MGLMKKEPKAPRMVDAREVKHSKHKLFLWIIWLLAMVLSAAYCAMSIVSFGNVQTIYKDKGDSLPNHVLWALLAATLLGPIVVIITFALGTLIIARKTIAESGLGYSFGILHISTLWLSVFMLQCGVTIQAFRETLKRDFEPRDDWEGGDTGLLQATYITAYVLAFVYLFLFLALYWLSNAARALNLGSDPAAATTPAASHHTTPTPIISHPDTPPPDGHPVKGEAVRPVVLPTPLPVPEHRRSGSRSGDYHPAAPPPVPDSLRKSNAHPDASHVGQYPAAVPVQVENDEFHDPGEHKGAWDTDKMLV